MTMAVLAVRNRHHVYCVCSTEEKSRESISVKEKRKATAETKSTGLHKCAPYCLINYLW